VEDFYRIDLAALDNFDLPVARFDRAGLLTYLNRAGERLLDAPVDGQVSLRTLFRNQDEYDKVVHQMALRVGGEASAYQTSFHRPGSAGDAPAIPVRVYAFPDTGSDGEVAGSLALLRDLREEHACRAIHHAIETIQDNRALFDIIAAEVAWLIPYDEFRITTVSEGRTHLRMLYSSHAQAGEKYPYRWWTMPAFIRETLKDYDMGVLDIEAMFATPAYQALLETDPHVLNYRAWRVMESQILPIHHNNQVVAFVALDSLTKGRFDDATVAMLGALPIADAVMAAMNREERTLRMATLDLIHTMSAMADNVHQAAGELVTRLARDFGWDHVAIFQIEGDPASVLLLRQASSARQYLQEGVCLDHTGAELATLAHNPVTMCHQDSRVHSPFAGADGFDPHGSQLIVPIRGRHTLWALNIECSMEQAFSTEEISLLEQIAHEAGQVLQRSALFELQRAVLEAIDNAVIETGADGMIRWCNAAARQMLHIDPGQERVPLSRLLPPGESAAAIEAAVSFSRRELTLQALHGAAIPVLLSCSTLPQHLGGKVYVASDYTYQRELRRQGALKEVFRHAAMEGRIPLSLAATWLEQCRPADTTTCATIDKVLGQLARADLPLERLLRLFSSPPESNLGMHADVSRAIAQTLREFPDNQSDAIEPTISTDALMVAADFNHVQFCIESMLSFGLRTKPQSRKLQLSTASEDGKAVIRVEGDWALDSGIDPETGELERWRRKALYDLTLGEAVLQHVALRSGGRFRTDFSERLTMSLELPLRH
jgi:PAS domain-containing protein